MLKLIPKPGVKRQTFRHYEITLLTDVLLPLDISLQNFEKPEDLFFGETDPKKIEKIIDDIKFIYGFHSAGLANWTGVKTRDSIKTETGEFYFEFIEKTLEASLEAMSAHKTEDSKNLALATSARYILNGLSAAQTALLQQAELRAQIAALEKRNADAIAVLQRNTLTSSDTKKSEHRKGRMFD